MLLTYSGQYVSYDEDSPAPTLQDIAVMLGRICRFNGACEFYWPVLAHSLAVASIVPEEAKLDALLHDAAEVVVKDIPRPIKTLEQIDIEAKVLRNIYSSLNTPWPTDDIQKIVSEADTKILHAECCLFGPPGILEKCGIKKEEDVAFEALKAVDKWSALMTYSDVLEVQGKYVIYFQKCVEDLLYLRYSPDLVNKCDVYKNIRFLSVDPDSFIFK